MGSPCSLFTTVSLPRDSVGQLSVTELSMNWDKKDWELTLAGIRSKQQLVRKVERRFPDTC